MKLQCLLIFLFSSLRLSAGDKLLFEPRDAIVALLGAPIEQIEHAPAALPVMDVRRFQKDGWNIVVYFDKDYSHRIIISKQDGAPLSDSDIAAFLAPNKSFNNWSQWKLSNRRAWVSDGKIGPFFALATQDAKSLELLTSRYLENLGRQTWLDSTEAKNDKPK